jgi:UDP-N-acetylglucosamine 2-epimerase (non-hydrolysing)/GDP/UDP-N,N'-diacetylbacillosamine 2-epimerase (hydrolysing)
MRKIAVVTGTRAEYGYLKPLMGEIESDNELELTPLITGMHLLPDFGNTYKIVENDFPKSIKVAMFLDGDDLKDMAIYLSSGIKNFAECFHKNPPDIIVILGDRSESLAAALAAMYLNIPITHINGGDVTGGTVDESIRHAITKIAHIHLANPNKKTFLIVQHPITTLKDKGYSQMRELFLALDSLKEQTIILYPNCDSGGVELIKLIEKYGNKDYFRVFKNLPHEDYLSLMKSANLMIGNSSSGIIESPSFKIPVINIGSRQKGRNRSGNIIDVEPEKNKILNAIDFAINNKDFLKKVSDCENKFGDGKASQRIIKILKNIEIDDKLIQKQITY